MGLEDERVKKMSGYKAYWSSLELISSHYALRCDAKFANIEFAKRESEIRKGAFLELGEFLPGPFVKGIQPRYLEYPSSESVPVVNTLSIQNLELNLLSCRHIDRSQFDELDDNRKLRKGDVLLTVDGGVSIGKAVCFEFDESMTIDSHIVALRPEGLSPLSLTYLLSSQLCQEQFRRAESGASGQTSVTEDDIRRFIVPTKLLDGIDQIAVEIHSRRAAIALRRQQLDVEEETLFRRLSI